MMWMPLVLAGTTFAQEAPPEPEMVESAVEESSVVLEDDTSVAPVLEKLAATLTELEGKGVQVTDIALGRVKDDGVGVKIELAPLSAGSSIVVAGVGDERRIVDLDLAVADKKGGRWTDQLSDNFPVVQFESADGGEFDATVIVSEPLEGATDGFFLLVSGFMSEPELVVSASNMVSMLQSASGLAEGMSLRFVTGGMVVMTAGQNSSIDLEIPGGSGTQCLLMGFGDPGRTKKLALTVTDKAGNVVGSSKGKGLQSAVVSVGDVNQKFRLVLTPKIGGGMSDSHAMALAACQ